MEKAKNKKNAELEVEVLNFWRAEAFASVVTNGKIARAYTYQETKKFAAVKQAIAWIEARGYNIAI